LVTPDNKQEENALWIHQDAYISTLNLKKESEFDYQVRIAGNGVFVFVIEGKITVDENELSARDAIGVSETTAVKVLATESSKILFIEVPMR
jgi:redox-sensitive bicupin YhaK (pirin superfamily)